jgi:hypothetical protein
MNWLINSWGWVEPILGWFGFLVEVVAVISAAVYLYRQNKAKRARLGLAKNGDYVWVVVQVGHPVVANFADQFGEEPDLVIDPEIDLGHLVISGEKDYSKLISKFRDFLKLHQDKEVRVITSGPTALNALLGQAAGPQYDVVWYQWDLDTKDYNPVPPFAGLL